MNFGVEYFASHDVDRFFTEQAEWFRHSDGRNTVAGGITDIFHGVDVCRLLKREMLTGVEELPNWGGDIIAGKVLGKGALQRFLCFLWRGIEPGRVDDLFKHWVWCPRLDVNIRGGHFPYGIEIEDVCSLRMLEQRSSEDLCLRSCRILEGE